MRKCINWSWAWVTIIRQNEHLNVIQRRSSVLWTNTFTIGMCADVNMSRKSRIVRITVGVIMSFQASEFNLQQFVIIIIGLFHLFLVFDGNRSARLNFQTGKWQVRDQTSFFYLFFLHILQVSVYIFSKLRFTLIFALWLLMS